jgi:hypothetical protein
MEPWFILFLVVCTGEWMSILYRNYAQEGSRNERRLNTNLKNVFDSNMTNILSVSVRYFIDYNIIKKVLNLLSNCNNFWNQSTILSRIKYYWYLDI